MARMSTVPQVTTSRGTPQPSKADLAEPSGSNVSGGVRRYALAGPSDSLYRQGNARRLRCLFIDNNATYMNPTRNQLPNVLNRAFDVVHFGPGYQSEEIVRAGAERFADQHAPFDFVIATEKILLPHYRSAEHILKYSYRSHWVPFNINLATLKEPFQFFAKFEGPKILTLLETDYFNMSQEQIELIEQSDTEVLGAGKELLPEYVSVPETVQHLSRTDRHILHWRTKWWDEFRRRNERRLISMPHHIGDDDVSKRPFQRRRAAWAIPGAPYTARVLARRHLKRAGIALSGQWLWFFQIAGLAGIPVYGSRRIQEVYNRAFRHVLSGTRYAYTCGSVLQIPVRKFLEIPASGGVLIVQPTKGFGALGFLHGENAYAAEPDMLLDLHRQLEGNTEQAQAIASAGQTAVIQRHHLSSRARQLALLANGVVRGGFAGSRWRNGEVEIRSEKCMEWKPLEGWQSDDL